MGAACPKCRGLANTGDDPVKCPKCAPKIKGAKVPEVEVAPVIPDEEIEELEDVTAVPIEAVVEDEGGDEASAPETAED